MCVGNLFAPPKAPKPPPRMRPAPPLKAATPPPEMPTPEKILEEDDEKVDTRKKKALEIKSAREGVKKFGAITPATTPSTPPGGVNTPT